MGHAVSTCTKHRKKFPSEVRRDVYRAHTFCEEIGKDNTGDIVRQQNTETDQVFVLLHSPARSLPNNEDMRHAGMGDSMTKKDSKGPECSSFEADSNLCQTVPIPLH